ncbi:MAG: sensory transduction histidine kinase, partial [Bacteroidota bacterium]|nr:sensory transduction histidine kinase [Bacteroidota bacterium]
MAGHPLEEEYITVTGNSGAEIIIRFRDLVEWTNEGIYCVNSNGLIVYANERFCKNLGYTKDEIINKPVFNIIYGEENVMLSKTKLELRKKGISDNYDIQMKKKNGDPIWVRMSGKPIIDTKGEFMGAIVISTEIAKQRRLEEELVYAKEDLEMKVLARTRQLFEANNMLNDEIKERKLAEVSLKNSEKRFRDIYLNSPDAIYIQSLDGVILDVNEATCRLHETKREELIGKTIFDISPERIHLDLRIRQPKIINGEISKFESESLAAEGKIIPVEISAALIDFRDQRALLVHLRDITDRKHNQQLLQKLNSELEEKVEERTRELQEMNVRMQLEIAEKEKIQNELQRQKDFLRLIIDSTPNLIFVKDENGKYLLANESVARFYNMKPSEMEGHSDSENHFSKKDIEDFKEQDDQVLAVGKEIQFPEKSIFNRETGERIWLQM